MYNNSYNKYTCQGLIDIPDHYINSTTLNIGKYDTFQLANIRLLRMKVNHLEIDK